MLTHKGTQTINSERLTLRRFTADDAQAMFNNWANDERVTKYLMWQPHGNIDVTKKILEQWVESYKNKQTYNWAIVTDGIIIGSIGVVNLDEINECCVIGYCISYDYWNKGITTKVCKSVINYLFNEVGFNRISSYHAVPNIGSGKVMKNSGMKYEGTSKKANKLNDGTFIDTDNYAILKSDLKN